MPAKMMVARKHLENMRFCETNRIGFDGKWKCNLLWRKLMRRRRVENPIRFVFPVLMAVTTGRMLVRGGQLGFALVLGGAFVAAVVDALAEVLEEEVDDRRGVEGEDLREQEAADDGDAERLAQFRAGADADGEGDGAEERGHGGHHDGAEADDAGLVDGVLRD